MTTLAANTPRNMEIGDHNDLAMIAADIIFEGAAVGIVKASGHARPLAAGDAFAGFAIEKQDNTLGVAGDKNIRVMRRGAVQLAVSGVVITDAGQPVYATDDDTFTLIPTGAVFVGFVKRWVSAGIAVVEFDASNFKDPYLDLGTLEEYETVSVNKTLDIQDTGKVLFVNTDAITITLPAIAVPLFTTLVNIGAFGAVALTISPNANDMIHAPDLAGTNDKDHINTKATAQRGDYCRIHNGDANGWSVMKQRGIWAQEG